MNEKMLRFGVRVTFYCKKLFADGKVYIYGFLRILVWVIFYGWYMQIIENSVVKVHMEIFLWDFKKIGFFL